MVVEVSSPILQYINRVWTEYHIEKSYRELMLSVTSINQMDKPFLEGKKGVQTLINLPILCCQALGGNSTYAGLISAIWYILYRSAHLFDMIEDDELDGHFNGQYSPSSIINAATGLVFTAELMLSDLEHVGVEDEAASTIRQAFNRTIFEMCGSQHLDLTLSEIDLDTCWKLAEKKSGQFFALACFAGARLATNSPKYLRKFQDYGKSIGTILQIADDLEGLWAKDEHDLVNGKWTLPVAYAMKVLPQAEMEELKQLLQQTTDLETVRQNIRKIVIESGAIIYLKLEAQKHKHEAENALQELDLPSESLDPLRSTLLYMSLLGER